MCDGTFEMCPDTAYQLYTMHGFHHGESMPLVWALLPNKTTATYVEMFTAVRDALVASFGDTGCSRTSLTDFETAAIKAVTIVFTEPVIKGCTFHFRQAVFRKVQSLGLKANYEDKDNPVVRDWLRQLMSMSMLPVFAIPLLWNKLQYPPATGDPITNHRLCELASYFGNTWVNGQEFTPTLWSHFDNLGPRTTNHVEGFHNSLNSTFGIPHPSLRSFMDWMQKAQFKVQCRIVQLDAGRKPKGRKPAYVTNDANLWAAKVQYGMQIASIFSCVFPHPHALEQFYAASDNIIFI